MNGLLITLCTIGYVLTGAFIGGIVQALMEKHQLRNDEGQTLGIICLAWWPFAVVFLLVMGLVKLAEAIRLPALGVMLYEIPHSLGRRLVAVSTSRSRHEEVRIELPESVHTEKDDFEERLNEWEQSQTRSRL
jgi:hypothetical protein